MRNIFIKIFTNPNNYYGKEYNTWVFILSSTCKYKRGKAGNGRNQQISSPLPDN